jgi:hypothetical protein
LQEATTLSWIKSTYCGSGACVEVALHPSSIFVRDAKQSANHDVLPFSKSAWRTFIEQVKIEAFTR